MLSSGRVHSVAQPEIGIILYQLYAFVFHLLRGTKRVARDAEHFFHCALAPLVPHAPCSTTLHTHVCSISVSARLYSLFRLHNPLVSSRDGIGANPREIGSVMLFFSADHRDVDEHWTTLTRRRPTPTPLAR